MEPKTISHSSISAEELLEMSY